MPLLDHFRSPLGEERHWESFHARWAAALADALNGSALPTGYVAEMQISLGGRVTGDVTSTAPALVLPAVYPDEFEVLIFSKEGGPTLGAAIEWVSPRNKDRPEARRAFAIRCLSYLQQGIGLIVVDVVTTRHFNMHDEMVDVLAAAAPRFPDEADLYAAAYHPVRRENRDEIDVWPVVLTVGENLPVMPLWLRDVPDAVRVDLEATYTETRQRLCLD